MLIRHDPHLSRGRFLLPIPLTQWRAPSISLPKDEFGNDGIRTRFRLRARLNDGHVVWRGWFDDRDDADAFLYALVSGSLRYERELWRLPTPEWHPGIGEELSYDFATVVGLTSPTGSNQTYTSPSDWNNSDNFIHCVGGGGSGAGNNSSVHSTGGGGGAYSQIANFSFATPGTTTATYKIGASVTGTLNANGTTGNPTWFNNATDPGNGTDNTKCSAASGGPGVQGAGSQNGGAGGATTSSWGQTKFAGGRGGNLTGASGPGGSGGGGAGGPGGAGNTGTDSALTSGTQTAGGSGGGGGSGGSSGTAGGGNGGAGADIETSYGSGGGGGGANGSATPQTGGNGGLYGGGGGGARGSNGTGGTGRAGLIVLVYTPLPAGIIWDPTMSFRHILVR